MLMLPIEGSYCGNGDRHTTTAHLILRDCSAMYIVNAVQRTAPWHARRQFRTQKLNGLVQCSNY